MNETLNLDSRIQNKARRHKDVISHIVNIGFWIQRQHFFTKYLYVLTVCDYKGVNAFSKVIMGLKE